MRDVSEVSDKTANHALCWLVRGHGEGRYGKIDLRSRLGRTYGGEVRAWWAVGIWERLVWRDCEGILRSGNRGENATATTREGGCNEMDNGRDACVRMRVQCTSIRARTTRPYGR